MLQTVLQQLESGERGNCILLHDAGGDRTETVKLIPLLVNELHKRGYAFVPVSALIDSNRDVVNPTVKPSDTLMLANDRIVFEAIYLFELFLGIAFVTAIILGTLRVVFVIILALIAKWRERHETFDAAYRPAVSVVIAAFNEETVIVNTNLAVLAHAARHRLSTLALPWRGQRSSSPSTPTPSSHTTRSRSWSVTSPIRSSARWPET